MARKDCCRSATTVATRSPKTNRPRSSMGCRQRRSILGLFANPCLSPPSPLESSSSRCRSRRWPDAQQNRGQTKRFRVYATLEPRGNPGNAETFRLSPVVGGCLMEPASQILIVEDSETQALQLRFLLEEEGWGIVRA